MKKFTFIISIFIIALLVSALAFAEDVILEMYVGEQMVLDVKAVVGDEIDDVSGIVWESTDPSISYVDSSNRVIGKNIGSTVIIGRLNQGNTILEVSFQVVVKTTVTSVVVNTPDHELRIGEEFTVSYDVFGTSNVNKSVEFTTSDSDVLSVSKAGEVKALGSGTAYIVVRSKENGKNDNVKVTVRETIESISIDQKTLKLYMGETSQMTVTYTPIPGETIFLDELEWIDFDDDIVSVSKTGVVKGVSVGKGSIRAVSVDGGKISTVSVNVYTGVKDVLISDKEVKLTTDKKTHQLSAEVIPIDELDEAFDKGVKWTSENTNVATVSGSGAITAKRSGTTLIIVESNDGGYKDFCQVTVQFESPDSISDPNVKLKNIEFDDMSYITDLGEKVKLELIVTPENANVSKVSFAVEPSNYGRVTKENGVYYYTSSTEGTANIVLKNDGVEYDQTIFRSKSMLDGFEIDESIFEDVRGANIIYLGQEIELVPDFDLAGSKQPYLSGVKYTSSDKNIGSISKNTVKGVNIGEFRITGVTEDGGYTDEELFKVVSNIREIETESKAQIGINMAYTPTIDFIPKAELLYGITEVLDKSYTLSIEETRISTNFVLNEISYMQDKKIELEAGLPVTGNELVENNKRLDLYEAIYETDSNGYCDILSRGRPLTDRTYKTLKISEIKSNKLYAYVSSRMELKVTTKDPDVESDIVITVFDDVSSIVIFDDKGKVIATSDGADIANTDVNDYTDAEILKNSPSTWALDAIKAANDNGLLIDEVLVGYQLPITRLETVELIMNFYDLVMDSPVIDYSGITFSDTSAVNVLKANKLGIISGIGDGMFAPDNNLTREQLCVIVNQTLTAMNKSMAIKRNDSYFADIDEISSWAKESLLKMIRDHSLISGVGNSLIDPRGLTTREQSIIIINKLFDSLIN